MIQIPGHHAPSFQIVSHQWVYYVAPTPTIYPTYNVQRKYTMYDTNKNQNHYNDKTRPTVQLCQAQVLSR